jgi:hypothetical protein
MNYRLQQSNQIEVVLIKTERNKLVFPTVHFKQNGGIDNPYDYWILQQISNDMLLTISSLWTPNNLFR